MSPPVPAFLEPVPVSIRLAQAVGITASAFMCGQSAAASFLLTPSLLEAPAPLLARQWLKARNIYMKINLPSVAGSVALFGWLASRELPDSMPRQLYTAAALLYFAKIPYSFLFLHPTDMALQAKAASFATTSTVDTAAEVGLAKEETTHALADKWATINLGRAILGFTGAACAVWATLGRVDVIRYRL
ncbi:putative peptidase s9 s15 protein [Lasiodiplodia theobromae]|uniref:DUF1772-domain-containing protein n=2 Tax=Lasiodiplodia TaxID=66739 RepID=A0A5N5DGB7_9PEZI|nr:uncharacterized protein LTHEOB_3310 [Lasiodiplodia theobromae]KAB2576869.1 hypothetical protein DBV05_g4549 [Lasiodiplodia theobromae]KAF4534502.1 hypothetical protein LTHEOB_3310 [Lasiodiplodia theobromae]KAF9636995.1 putative peptidase s9 s15 protein [Lasiodiplodia theobromae]KAK0650937.1 hypothetical protein DIS24_g6360 [Lasiodiplodia hormozganensis]